MIEQKYMTKDKRKLSEGPMGVWGGRWDRLLPSRAILVLRYEPRTNSGRTDILSGGVDNK